MTNLFERGSERVKADPAASPQNIAKDLKADQVLVFTVATGYFLAQTVFQLVFSHVSHAVGRKYAYLCGVSLYSIGAVVATTSKTPEQLIGARVLQGIGAAGMFTMSAIVIVDIMQPRQRAAWTAVSQACGALGNICGPLFAALLFRKYSWVSPRPLLACLKSTERRGSCMKAELTQFPALSLCVGDRSRWYPPSHAGLPSSEWAKSNDQTPRGSETL